MPRMFYGTLVNTQINYLRWDRAWADDLGIMLEWTEYELTVQPLDFDTHRGQDIIDTVSSWLSNTYIHDGVDGEYWYVLQNP